MLNIILPQDPAIPLLTWEDGVQVRASDLGHRKVIRSRGDCSWKLSKTSRCHRNRFPNRNLMTWSFTFPKHAQFNLIWG